MITLDDGIPYFELLGVDTKTYSPESFAKKRVLVVLFTCNHCPYVQAYEQRIKQLQEFFSVQGVQFVCINSNDASSYPEDSFLNMQKRAKKEHFNFVYLHDPTQVIAQKFGAQTTPEAFVFDKNHTLKYHGRIDDNWQHAEKVKSHDLKAAISDVLAGKNPDAKQHLPLGCSIKWK